MTALISTREETWGPKQVMVFEPGQGPGEEGLEGDTGTTPVGSPDGLTSYHTSYRVVARLLPIDVPPPGVFL